MNLQANDPAPNFSAPDQNNKTHSLADYSGKWLLLYFYPRDFTPGCTTEACGLRDASDELGKLVSIVGVSADSIESHKKFEQKHNLPFTLLADEDKTIIKAYEADGKFKIKRTSFLIGTDSKIKKIYEKVSPSEHAEMILNDVKELQKAA